MTVPTTAGSSKGRGSCHPPPVLPLTFPTPGVMVYRSPEQAHCHPHPEPCPVSNHGRAQPEQEVPQEKEPGGMF